MRESLYIIYNHIYQTKKWAYYKRQNANSICLPLLNSCDSQDFIKGYFTDGGKSSLLDGIRFSDMRCEHTISCFFLGIYLRQCFGIDKKKRFKPSFLYLWFLTCLYHDSCFFLEENSGTPPQINTDIVEDDKIDDKSIPDIITLDIIKAYSRYRSESVNVDHGIIAGKMLYDRLLENYKKKKKSVGNGQTTFYDIVGDRELKLSDTHFRYYSKSATAIIAHNIFIRPTEEDVKKQYRQYGLEDLIEPERYNFSYDQSLFFLLLIADSLEPLKRFSHLDAENVLKNIYLSKDEDGLRISYDGFDVTNESLGRWIEQVVGLKDFINLDITKENSSILLSLNFLKS